MANYQIISDSCCDYTNETDLSFVRRVALTIDLDDDTFVDDAQLDCTALVKTMAASPNAPKSACPSPGAWEEAFDESEGDIYVVTLSKELSGSYNSAEVAAQTYMAEHPGRNIHVFNSRSAAAGQVLLCLEIKRLAESGLPFEDVVQKAAQFRDAIATYFVLESMEVFRKNGRLSRLQSLAIGTLRLKLVMRATDIGYIEPAAKALSLQQALDKMVHIIHEKTAGLDLAARTLVITHVDCPARAAAVRDAILSVSKFGQAVICRASGISSMYANGGGVIVSY